MTSIKTKTAEALFPLLSAFHDVNGLVLKAVGFQVHENSLTGITFDFGMKILIVKADGEDDTVEFWSTDSRLSDRPQEKVASDVRPWGALIGQEFGWGWVTVNQQGYMDGIVLSFAGIIPRILITVVASSLKVSQIELPMQTLAAS